jgi:hypothetical protein
MSTTLLLDDIREQARIHYGSSATTLFVQAADGSSDAPGANRGERPTDSFQTLWAAMQQRATLAATRSVTVAFDGLQDFTVANPLLYDTGIPGFDRRVVALPANTRLIGASPATSKIWFDGVGTNYAHLVTCDGDDCEIENFAIKAVGAPSAFQLPIGFHSGQRGPGNSLISIASKRVRVRRLLIDAQSDGFYFKTTANGEVADWIVEDCVVRTNYDAHTILGDANIFSPDVRIQYRNCNLTVRGPATTSPFNICRAVTGSNGTALFHNCRLITETTGAPTNFLACVYARSSVGQVARIELHDCLALTKVPAGYVGTNARLMTDAGCTILASRVSGDRNKDAPGTGTITYLGDGSQLVISPLLASTTNPRFAVKDLPAIAAGSAPADVWTIVDATGAAVDLSAKTVRLVAYKVTDAVDADSIFDDVLAGSFKYESPSDGITVGGAGSNQVTVQHSSTKTAVAGDYLYVLWNVTDRLVLAKGKMPIVPTVFDV